MHHGVLVGDRNRGDDRVRVRVPVEEGVGGGCTGDAGGRDGGAAELLLGVYVRFVGGGGGSEIELLGMVWRGTGTGVRIRKRRRRGRGYSWTI